MDIRTPIKWQLVVAFPILTALGCVPTTVQTPSPPVTTDTFNVGPGSTVQFRVDPRTTVRGPIVHVHGEWDVRVQNIANTYIVYVMPRSSQPTGTVHIVAGPHDDVRVQVGQVPSVPQVPPQPVAITPYPPHPAPSMPKVAPPPIDHAPKTAAEEPRSVSPASASSARERLRGTLDTSDPWAP